VKQPGRVAYETFYATLVSYGVPSRIDWDALPVEQQNAWIEAAEAVLAADQPAAARRLFCSCGTECVSSVDSLGKSYKGCPRCTVADQPAATETAPVCDYWPNGPAPCGKPATHRSRSGTRLFCSYHAVDGDEPLTLVEPQGAPDDDVEQLKAAGRAAAARIRADAADALDVARRAEPQGAPPDSYCYTCGGDHPAAEHDHGRVIRSAKGAPQKPEGE
jgi:hypothetical protein